MSATETPFSALLGDKLVSPQQAVSHIRSGTRVLVGSGCAQPETLVRAMAARAAEVHDVEVVHLLTFGMAEYVDEESEGHYRHNAFFIGNNVREAVSQGRADYTPIFLSEIPELIRSGQRPVDTVLLQLSPPDRHGYCSMGIAVDIQRAALESASVVIAEINPNMPRTHGNTSVHVSQIDYAVEVDTPALELLAPAEPDQTSAEIGAHVARLIDDGSCLPLGSGGVPNAVLSLLGDKRDLGVHSEMFSDGMLPLLENGNVNNSRKTIHRGKSITSFVLGSRKLYDYIDDNVSVEFYTSDFVNDPRIVCQNDNVVAVNSALQVDLTGQVSADSIGYRFYSGIGGQVDFVRGASMSRGGKPIIALPSTAKGGTVSRIAPHLMEGAGVVTSRGDVHYVVTEFGVAYLHGKTIRERSLALINIAHPDFRRELLDFVREKHYVSVDEQIWQQAINRYPADWETKEEFGDEEMVVRPLRATDERLLQEFFYGHSEETIRQRYFANKDSLSHVEAAHLCCVDYENRMAFGVFEKDGAAERFVAVARYDLNPRTNLAGIAVVVREDRRRRGIARYLMERLMDYARSKGIAGIRSEFRAERKQMLRMHQKLGHHAIWNPELDLFTVEVSIQEDGAPPAEPGS